MLDQASTPPSSIDDYIATFPPEIQAIFGKIRACIHAAVPEAEEAISYRMPAFRMGAVLVYFAAFKQHIGLYPPVRGDAALTAEVAPYAGEKGNLRFRLDQPMPYALIERIARLRRDQVLAAAAQKRTKTKAAKSGTKPEGKQPQAAEGAAAKRKAAVPGTTKRKASPPRSA